MIWYEIIYSVCFALFISGLALTILFFILSAVNLSHSGSSDSTSDSSDSDANVETDGHDFASDHSIDHSMDHSIETDHSLDHSIEVDHSLDHSVELDHSIDHSIEADSHELSHDTNATHMDTHDPIHTNITEVHSHALEGNHGDTGADTDDGILTLENKTPFTLIFSLYILWFGAIGFFTYDAILEKFLWLALIILFPIGIAKGISMIWHRVARNVMYRVRQEQELLGKRATVKVDITEEGGTIAISTAYFVHQVPAKSYYPMAKFYSNEEVYIWAFHDGFYYVDSQPRTQTQEKKKPDQQGIEIPATHEKPLK